MEDNANAIGNFAMTHGSVRIYRAEAFIPLDFALVLLYRPFAGHDARKGPSSGIHAFPPARHTLSGHSRMSTALVSV